MLTKLSAQITWPGLIWFELFTNDGEVCLMCCKTCQKLQKTHFISSCSCVYNTCIQDLTPNYTHIKHGNLQALPRTCQTSIQLHILTLCLLSCGCSQINSLIIIIIITIRYMMHICFSFSLSFHFISYIQFPCVFIYLFIF